MKEVAVKTIESGASEEQRIKFLQEAAIMGQFNNPYIVKIFGVITSSQPVGIYTDFVTLLHALQLLILLTISMTG